MNKNKLTIVMMLLALAGCKGGDNDVEALEKAAESGPEALTVSTDDTHFYNKKFELRVEKPEGWYSQSVEDTMRMAAMGGEALSGGDVNMKAALDASLKGTLTLFSFFEFPPGTPGKANSSVVSLAEYIGAYPGIKNGCDYLNNMTQVMSQSQMQMTFGKCQQDNISSSTFGYIDASMLVGNQLVKQRYWACKKGEHAIAMVQTYYDETQKASTTGVIKAIDVQCDSV